jgi:hypothetical protein
MLMSWERALLDVPFSGDSSRKARPVDPAISRGVRKRGGIAPARRGC